MLQIKKHGKLKTHWRLAAKRPGKAIPRVNPRWLIIVAGIEHRGASEWYWCATAWGPAPVRQRVGHHSTVQRQKDDLPLAPPRPPMPGTVVLVEVAT